MDLLRAAVVDALRFHPRVAQQKIAGERAARERLAATLPTLIPFRGRAVQKVVALLDWDHRLPSKQLTLRVHAFYSAPSVERFEEALSRRGAEIQRKDLFPEFDVPDYVDLPGDESYDVDLSGELNVDAMRLVSPWRREVDNDTGNVAVRAVRSSTAFTKAKAAHPGRSQNLGDLEAVAWMPPCESGQARWTIDVWWLTAFDGRIGKGWSFLVDTDPSVTGDRIVAHREFTVRTG
ncbi:MAG: hypothetical protein EXR72_01770 [Myxococcales bacterium]|nr:hypothetical protein [Myxococcales bacterium]